MRERAETASSEDTGENGVDGVSRRAFLRTSAAGAGATAAAERLRKAVEADETRFEGKAFRITISAGVAEYRDGLTASEFIDLSDRALYRAKNTGRNRVCFCDAETDEARAATP